MTASATAPSVRRRLPEHQPRPWTPTRIVWALARDIGYITHTLVTEADLPDGSRADLISISKAGYLTEYELKVSRSDWHQDILKERWQAPPERRNIVKRFFYVVPETIAQAMPPWLDVNHPAGIVVVHANGPQGYDRINVAREPRFNMQARKVTDREKLRYTSRFYYRWWGHRMSELEEQRYRRLHPSSGDPP